MGVRLKAIRETTGSYGHVRAGEHFEAPDPETAKSLVDRGVAQRAGGSERSTRKSKGATETKSRSAAKKSSSKSAKKSSSASKSADQPGDKNVISTSSYRGADQSGEGKAQ